MEQAPYTYRDLAERRAQLLAQLETIASSPRPEDREELTRARVALERVEYLIAHEEYV